MKQIVKSDGNVISVDQQRAIQEIQARIIVSQKFPRDEDEALERILKACQNSGLAAESEYLYPRGGQLVEGPSIRLLETIARNWKNLEWGIRELSNQDGVSELEAYAWDLQFNSRNNKVFNVKHLRAAGGAIKRLSDPRDIYEMTANMGARRVRACLEAIIPKHITDAAQQECRKTFTMATRPEDIKNRIPKMLEAFKKHGVSREQIEQRMRVSIDKCGVDEFYTLLKIYNSIAEGMTKPDAWFTGMPKHQTSDVNERLSEPVDEETDLKEPAPMPDEKTKPRNYKGLILEALELDEDNVLEAMQQKGLTNIPQEPKEQQALWEKYQEVINAN